MILTRFNNKKVLRQHLAIESLMWL